MSYDLRNPNDFWSNVVDDLLMVIPWFSSAILLSYALALVNERRGLRRIITELQTQADITSLQDQSRERREARAHELKMRELQTQADIKLAEIGYRASTEHKSESIKRREDGRASSEGSGE